MNRHRLPRILVPGFACITAWAAGFALQRLATDRATPPAAPEPPRFSQIGSPANGTMTTSGTAWESTIMLDHLAASLKPEEWPAALRGLQEKNRWLAQSLMLRWLERDLDAALEFAAQATRGSGSFGMERVAVQYLAAVDPERGWKWSVMLGLNFSSQCLAELLATLCGQDPAAAARLVAAHADSTAAWGIGFPDLPAAAGGPALKALAGMPGPDSLLKRRMMLHTMSAWASKDFKNALGWWRQQSPQLQGLTLRGLGMGLHILSPGDESDESKERVQLSPSDLTSLADAAVDYASPEDRRDFIARFLIHMSPTDPVAAVQWVAANLHGEERQDCLNSALAYLKPQGALEVVKAWDQLPQTGWPEYAFHEIASNAAGSDPAKTLNWMLKLPAFWAGEAAGPVGQAWGAHDAAAARRIAESLTGDDAVRVNFAAGVTDAILPKIPTRGPDVPMQKPDPDQVREQLAPAWSWASQLPGSMGAAASEKVLGLWVIFDPPQAANAATQLTDPVVRTAGLRVVTENFFMRSPDQAIAWTATLPAPDRQIIRDALNRSNFNPAHKAELLTKLADPPGS